MIQTFNKKLQISNAHYKKGLELSLGSVKDKKSSRYSNQGSIEARNKSLPLQNSKILEKPNIPKLFSVQKKPQVRIVYSNNNTAMIKAKTSEANVIQKS